MHSIEDSTTVQHGRAMAFAARQLGTSLDMVELQTYALHGGLESAAVARWVARRLDEGGQQPSLEFVVKRLDGLQQREAVLYAHVLSAAGDLSPALLHFEHDPDGAGYLYLEYVRPARQWPWTNAAAAGMVLVALAALHSGLLVQGPTRPDLAWNYEADLAVSARSTLELYERVTAQPELGVLRWASAALRRTCAALPSMRSTLLSTHGFGAALIHGDVHSGNAVLTERGDTERVVLFDWGRARIGSPLEDVASWLQSLGYWEPEARRKHDTLLRTYLVARGYADTIPRAVRDAYWFAAASNVLAGALRYHLAVASDMTESPGVRVEGARAARDDLRVLRRADLLWRS